MNALDLYLSSAEEEQPLAGPGDGEVYTQPPPPALQQMQPAPHVALPQNCRPNKWVPVITGIVLILIGILFIWITSTYACKWPDRKKYWMMYIGYAFVTAVTMIQFYNSVRANTVLTGH